MLWAAVAVVFSRAKVVADLAAQQDAENHRLWQAIDTLRAGADVPGAGKPTGKRDGPAESSTTPDGPGD